MYIITEDIKNAIIQALSAAIHPTVPYATVAQLMQAVHEAPKQDASKSTDKKTRATTR